MMGLDDKNRNITIDINHYKVHDGRMFNFSYKATLTSGLIRDFYLITGNDDVHLAGNINVEGKLYWDLIEAPSITAAVTITTLSSYNMNRNRSNTASIEFGIANTHGATVASGTAIKTSAIFAGLRTQKFSGEGDKGIEWELKDNTTYLLRIEDKSASNNEYFFDFEFYEE